VVDAADLVALSWIEGKEFGDPDRFLWGSPIEGDQVIVSAERREQRLSDPISVGVIGSLVFGGLATTVIVMIATWFGVSTAVSTRTFELALLRALGITRARMAAMVGRENLLVAALGTGAGLVIGLGLALSTLDTLVRDSDGVPVVPSPFLVIPWQGVVGAVIVGLGGMAAAVSFTRRSIDEESPGAIIRAGEER
jgi:predicted lysophospholipase L1 biosynthesis ABC-type transport system permease subunit